MLALLMPATIVSADNSPLAFTAKYGDVAVRFDIKNVTHTIQYSIDGVNWNTYTSNSVVTIHDFDTIYFRAKNSQPTATAFGAGYDHNSSRFYFSSSDGGVVDGLGNIMSLYGLDCPNLPLQIYAFAYMFKDCRLLTKAPSLPATTLAGSCYSNMFEGCTSLSSAPSLPATTLADCCYSSMFEGCISLSKAPSLPATTLADYCYCSMFEGCTSLSAAPSLPAQTLANMCYEGMFLDCTSLSKAPALPATKLARSCYSSMFYCCTSLTTATALPATILDTACYYCMFAGCESLTAAPELPATSLYPICYEGMFNCCTSLTTAPSLPATKLAQGCYIAMFGYTGLKTPPSLPATILADNCYYYMFVGCDSLTTIPALPATTLVEGCYNAMFENCSSLELNTSSPGKEWIIPATTTATEALTDMFSGTSGTMNGTPELNTTYYIASYSPSAVDNVMQENKLFLFPNPVGVGEIAYIKLQLNDNKMSNVTVDVLTENGMLVDRIQSDESTIIIDNLNSAGTYFVKLTTVDGLTYTEKLIVK